MVLMVSFSCRISPETLTVIFFDRSPPAIATAEEQGALSFALRGATSLVQSCDSEDRRREALGVLARVYGLFSEGLETPDLQDARSLLRSATSAQEPA